MGFYVLYNKIGKYDITGFDTWQDAALDYFGFEGKYDPNNALFDKASENHAGAITDPNTGDIFYNDIAFEGNYDNLYFKADHESMHRQNVLSGKFKNVKIDDIVHGKEEWSVYQKNYARQGLYPKSGITTDEIVNNITSYGRQGGIYEFSINQRGNGILTKFEKKWWHILYRISRRW